MMHDDLIGVSFLPNNGEGLTLQDLLELIRNFPAKARQNYVRVNMGGESAEVTGIAFAQSDQAEKWEFKIYITTDYKETK
jgi:hypothetical protein